MKQSTNETYRNGVFWALEGVTDPALLIRLYRFACHIQREQWKLNAKNEAAHDA